MGLQIGNVTVNLDLNETSAKDNDEDYLSPMGFIVENVEDSLEDQEITIWVPEEELTAEISIYGQ